jgi:hypothetical protein
MGGFMSYGWYHLFHGQREKIEYGREKAWARIHLTPVLQAEEDRDQVRRYYADQKRERELLGGNTKVYNSDRYVAIPLCFGEGLVLREVRGAEGCSILFLRTIAWFCVGQVADVVFLGEGRGAIWQ